MTPIEQLIAGDSIKIDLSLREEDIIKTTAYLSISIFIVVVLAIIVAKKIS